MARVALFTSAIVGLGALTEAKLKAANEVQALSKDMSQSLSKIAGRFLSKAQIDALVTLSSPKDQFINQIDLLQKEIIKECHDETDTFNEWLQSKQNDLYNNNQQLSSLQGHLGDVQNTIAQLQGELNGAKQDQDDVQAQLDSAQNDLQSYQQQLQDAIDQRQKSHDQNEDIIKQHQDSLAVLQGLRDLVANFDVNKNDVLTKQLAKVPKVNRLHKHASKINALIASVKDKLAKALAKDPQEKAKIKNTLLQMIDGVIAGVQDSLNQYQAQEDALQQKFDNEVKPGLEQMISQTEDRIASIQAQLGQVVGDIGSIQSDLDRANDDLDQTQTQITTLQGLIQSLDDQIQQGTDAHNAKQDKCKADLDALEEIRQYVADHVHGATPGNNCNPESPTCPRCLYDGHCSQGQICLDQGICGVPPTTAPPKQGGYSALITDVVGTQTGRRVDVGVVSPDSYSNGDYTYIFKYQQLADANGWSNLFNVVPTQPGWPFPNQAALFLTGNMFEIDVCDGSKQWGDSYWYRNFYLDQVELNQWNSIAFIVSGSTRSVTFVHRDSAGKIKSQSWADYHGNVQQFPQTGIYVNGRDYNSLQANFADFRRYEHALTADEVEAVFNQFFP